MNKFTMFLLTLFGAPVLAFFFWQFCCWQVVALAALFGTSALVVSSVEAGALLWALFLVCAFFFPETNMCEPPVPRRPEPDTWPPDHR